MQAEWDQFSKPFPAPRKRQVGAAVMRRYQGRGRHYHTLEHIGTMLRLCDEYERQLKKPQIVRTAIWFHDAVYNSRRRDNEDKSYDLCIEMTHRLGWIVIDGAGMILATKRHSLDKVARGMEHDTAWFLDFDLAVLGSDPAAYDAYAQAIRREYAWVKAGEYAAGRAKVLRAFLERPYVFFNKELRGRWEQQAQVNLLRELSRYESERR